jgi:hypothetical protein
MATYDGFDWHAALIFLEGEQDGIFGIGFYDFGIFVGRVAAIDVHARGLRRLSRMPVAVPRGRERQG